MRILTVIRHPVGGIRTYLEYVYGYLEAGKHDFIILTVEEREASLIKASLAGHQVDLVQVPDKHFTTSMIHMIALLLRRKQIDLIHSQGFTAGVLAGLANLIPRKPHIITLHETLSDDRFLPPFGFLRKRILALMLERADRIHCVSRDAVANLLSMMPWLAGQAGKLKVISHGIRIERFSELETPTTNLREELGVGDGKFLFGFLGRFMPDKGFAQLVEAAEELSKDPVLAESFKIVAVNDGSFIREYKTLIKKKGLEYCFSFHGFVPDVGGILHCLDAAVMPSLREACGLLAMEALVCGCPVIGTDCIGLREVLADTPAVIAKAGDSHALADALRAFMRNSSEVKRKTEEYSFTAKNRFDGRKTAEELESLFLEVIEQRRIG
jgi:glycosyltransferase involved in cell wall biosynthesis